MGLRGRHIVGIGDLARADLELLFRCADRFAAQPRGQAHLGRGYQLATLFFEPSTRTRLSFESAMNRLGGAVLTVADRAQSSVAKGETLADTIRVVSAYADIIALRHPWEGAARLAADVATVPVVNAGDGAHEHPTQTLCDLYTLYREFGGVAGRTVTLYGDLKYGRTVHSLACGLACCGARLIFAPGDPALAPPAYLLDRLRAVCGCEPGWWFPDGGAPLPHTDALYLTRIQRERFAGHAAGVRAYPRVDRDLLRRWDVGERTLLMHPLPRAGELDPDLDGDPRSAYFRQAANGVPVRMALLALLLGLAEEEWGSGWAGSRPAETCATAPRHPGYRAAGVACANPSCVTRHEPVASGPRFDIAGEDGGGLDLRCRYCEHPARAAGAVDLTARLYRPAGDPGLRALLDSASPNGVLLVSAEEDAIAAGLAVTELAVGRGA
ncbi:MAG TPA: aspartate carbamoyltransferase [Thermomicrobiales bacterium]|nr:aspartate carbamoyltransferase [Thermomicrobiales bacterium]